MKKLIFLLCVLALPLACLAAEELHHELGFTLGAGINTPGPTTSHDGSRSFTGSGFAAKLTGFYSAELASWFAIRPAIGVSSKGLVESGRDNYRATSALVSARIEAAALFLFPLNTVTISLGIGPFLDIALMRENTNYNNNAIVIVMGNRGTPLSTLGPMLSLGVASNAIEGKTYGAELQLELGNALEMSAERTYFTISVSAAFVMGFEL